MKLSELLERFDGVVGRGESWKCLCPCHADVSPSLSITLRGNKILLYCQAGCETKYILDDRGLEFSDLFDPDTASAGSSVTRAPVSDEVVTLRDQVYGELLGALGLSYEHRQHLVARGLGPWIEENQYASLDFYSACQAVRDLGAKYGSKLGVVPGFVASSSGFRPSHTSGLLVPVRDMEGRVQGLKVRSEGLTKYHWFSSSALSVGNLCHVPRGRAYYQGLPLRITEGELKADVCLALDEINVISVPGVAAWRGALPLVKALTPSEVHLAYDADWKRKPKVQEALFSLKVALEKAGHRVCVEVWEERDGKGIDDLLLAGKRPQFREGVCV